jgi:hypothetical protein
MSGFKTVQLKKRTFEMLEPSKQEFLRHHKEWDLEMVSNDKIIFEALKFYLAVESGNAR